MDQNSIYKNDYDDDYYRMNEIYSKIRLLLSPNPETNAGGLFYFKRKCQQLKRLQTIYFEWMIHHNSEHKALRFEWKGFIMW